MKNTMGVVRILRESVVSMGFRVWVWEVAPIMGNEMEETAGPWSIPHALSHVPCNMPHAMR